MLCTAVQCMEPSFCLIGRTFSIPPPVPQRGKRVFLWKLELYRLILCAGALAVHLDATRAEVSRHLDDPGAEAMHHLDDPEAEAMRHIDAPSWLENVQKFHVKHSFSQEKTDVISDFSDVFRCPKICISR